MEQHPLYFFIDLIERKKISDLRSAFLFVNPDLEILSINEQEEYIQFLDFDCYEMPFTNVSYFSNFLDKKVTEKKIEAQSSIDLLLLNRTDQNQLQIFIGSIVNIIDDLCDKCSKYSDAMKYPIIASELIDLKLSLNKRYLNSIKNLSNSQSLNKNEEIIKLKWNAGVASLCTMFYELANDYKLEKKGISYLSSGVDQLEKFLMTYFVNEDGAPFARDSIKTYLQPRADKKAKRDKVDLDRIFENPDNE
ncbi:hypothetical protein SIO70_02395 [Chitinophaga sancti]|uniref:hypothetical protein n=1 Tax=Chitinophaga sancti TaxID=1004 RepID=UPI002A764DA1|nr:hypothetical protein [Chitinophaga sancti]WPQ63708.1 hypothetical protein SIO70_02395 [Chitinophaga sancti]